MSLKVKPGGKIPIFYEIKLAKILTNTRSENNTVEDEIVALFIFFFDRTRGNLWLVYPGIGKTQNQWWNFFRTFF